ncbi:MAG: hypothetical protein FD130_1684, partial [Halothiobacillaceae bacterium]
MKAYAVVALFSSLTFTGVSYATTVLYTQNFENPNLTAFNANLGPD